jgi:hypothetical protein
MLFLVGYDLFFDYDSEEFELFVEKRIPNSELVAFEGDIYTFSNSCFEFEIENSKEMENNYLYRLISYKYNDIIELAEKYNIEIICDDIEKTETPREEIYDRMVENPNKFYIEMLIDEFDNENKGLVFHFYLNDISNIEPAYDFIYEFYALLQDYLPMWKNNDLHFLFSFLFYTKETMLENPMAIMCDKTILLSRRLEIGLDERCLKSCYMNNIRIRQS